MNEFANAFVREISYTIRVIDLEIKKINEELETVERTVEDDLKLKVYEMTKPGDELPDLTKYIERFVTIKKVGLERAKKALLEYKEKLKLVLEYRP